MEHKLYPSQQPTEKIYLVVRETFVLLFLRVLFIAILMIVPLVGSITLNLLDISLTESDLASTLISVAIQLYYLGTLIALYVILVIWYLNINVVSNERVVDIDQRGLLYREVSELNIETIEDVTTETRGLLGNLFNFGTVFIQTAGATERFEFNNVPNPNKISSLVLELFEAHEKQEGNKKRD